MYFVSVSDSISGFHGGGICHDTFITILVYLTSEKSRTAGNNKTLYYVKVFPHL